MIDSNNRVALMLEHYEHPGLWYAPTLHLGLWISMHPYLKEKGVSPNFGFDEYVREQLTLFIYLNPDYPATDKLLSADLFALLNKVWGRPLSAKNLKWAWEHVQ